MRKTITWQNRGSRSNKVNITLLLPKLLTQKITVSMMKLKQTAEQKYNVCSIDIWSWINNYKKNLLDQLMKLSLCWLMIFFDTVIIRSPSICLDYIRLKSICLNLITQIYSSWFDTLVTKVIMSKTLMKYSSTISRINI